MDKTLAWHSPLEDLAPTLAAASLENNGAVTLREVPFLAQVNLRADPADRDLLARLGGVLGFALPTDPNTVAVSDTRSALWLGPDEWLVIGPVGSERELEQLLREALAHTGGSVVDLSANRTVLELAGPMAREVLMKGCSIDLHPRAFGPGRCAQTALARAAVILHQTSNDPAYRIFVRSSFATYLARWLIDAMSEYQTPSET